MSLLPLPSRLPARKHLLAIVFGALGLSVMVAAVVGASGLGSPFRSGGPQSVRTGAVLVDEPSTTTTSPPTAAGVTTTSSPRRVGSTSEAGGPPVTNRSDTGPPTTRRTGTTTTLLPITTTTTVDLFGGIIQTFGGQ